MKINRSAKPPIEPQYVYSIELEEDEFAILTGIVGHFEPNILTGLYSKMLEALDDKTYKAVDAYNNVMLNGKLIHFKWSGSGLLDFAPQDAT